MLWRKGAYSLLCRHYWTERIAPGPQPNTARVVATDRFKRFDDIEPGKWRISMVGVDHGRLEDNQFCEPGAAIQIEGCTHVEINGKW